MIKELTWTVKDAVIEQRNKEGKLLGTYLTQDRFAKQNNYSQSQVSKIMKKDIEEQIEKYGFYLKYRY